MKKIICLLTIVASAAFAFAQVATIRTNTNMATKGLIVRYWDHKHSVHYISANNGRGFALCLDGDNHVFLAVLPDYIEINDFEILNDTVFFCGHQTINGSTYGIFGFFGIEDLFYSHGSIHSWSLWQGYSPLINDYCVMTKPLKLDVYRHNGDLHIALAGESVSFNNGIVHPRTSILDARFNGTIWDGFMYYNKDSSEYYYDVAATDNYLVATAGKVSGSGCFLRIFNKSTNTLATPVNFQYLVQIGGGIVNGATWAQKMGNDIFAIANYSTHPSGAGLAVKTFHITPSTPSIALSTALHAPLSSGMSISAAWTLKEMRYNSFNRHILVLQTMSHPVSSSYHDVVCEFDMNNIASHTSMASWIQNATILSVDKFIDDNYYSVGEYNSSSFLLFRKHCGVGSVCTEGAPYSFSVLNNVALSLIFSNEDIAFINTRYYPIAYNMTDLDLHTECEN